jgi:hypothetical protein
VKTSKGITETIQSEIQVKIEGIMDALPYYPQEKISTRLGVDILLPTMCGLAMKVAEQCEP